MATALRFCFFGNQGNASFRTAKYLRKIGIDCHVYIIKKNRMPARSSPEMVDADFLRSSFDWVNLVDSDVSSDFFRDIEQKFDLVVVSGALAIQLGRKFDAEAVPIAAHATGPMNVPAPEAGDQKRLTAIETLENASIILTAHPETYGRLSRLGLCDKVRFHLPLLDVDDIQARVNSDLYESLRDIYGGYDHVFCWFSRNVTDPSDPCYKGTEIFVQSAAEFLRRNPRKNIRFVFGNHGPQAAEAHDLIRRLGLEPHTDEVSHLDYPDLLAYLALANVSLFDNLAQGTVSAGIFRDAMSMGTVLVRRMVAKDAALAYGEMCPVINAGDVESCVDAMDMIAAMSPADMAERRVVIREWARAHLHWEHRVQSYADMLREPVLRRRLAQLDEP